ncbi:MAG: hypothetical protein J6Y89_04985 [Lachnospiraceae bacterium]|nr:hypothetical protein [Lachnospiraceae bacterium]
MKNADYIRSLDDTKLARFLWTWGENNLTSFMKYGGEKLMNADKLRDWLNKDIKEFVCEETFVSDEMAYDQEFNIKEGNNSGWR